MSTTRFRFSQLAEQADREAETSPARPWRRTESPRSDAESPRSDAHSPRTDAERLRPGSGEPLDDVELVARASADPSEFDRIYERHAPQVGSLIHRRLGDPVLTEELLAETFAVALQSLNRYRGRSGLRLWLFGIASHLVSARIRSLRRDRRLMQSLSAAPPPVAPREGSELEREEERAATRERLALVRRLILELPAKQQSVLTLCCLEGLSEAEVATALGIRPGTVKSRLHRARQSLDRLLRRHLPEEDQ